MEDFYYRKPKLTIRQGSEVNAELRGQVLAAGALDRDYWFYTREIIFVFGGIFFGAYLLSVWNAPALVFLASLVIGFFSIQIGGLMHDAGHRAIFNSARLNDVVGELCAVVTAMSYENWKVNHNKHHADPNSPENDPDMSNPIHAFNFEQLAQKRGLSRFIVKYQALFYFPLRSLVFVSMRTGSFKFWRANLTPRRMIQVGVFAAGLFVWYVLPFLVFPIWKALVFLVAANFLAGFYSSNLFAPNHKGMPQISKGLKISFFEQQIVTSRDLTGSWLVDFIYLGLNYQIAHHLFPNCARRKLKLASAYVRRYCDQYSLPYAEATVFEANGFILGRLRQVSAGA